MPARQRQRKAHKMSLPRTPVSTSSASREEDRRCRSKATRPTRARLCFDSKHAGARHGCDHGSAGVCPTDRRAVSGCYRGREKQCHASCTRRRGTRLRSTRSRLDGKSLEPRSRSGGPLRAFLVLNPLAASRVKHDTSQGADDVGSTSVFHGERFHDLRLHGAGHALAGVAFRKRPAANLQGRRHGSRPDIAAW